MKDKEIRIPGQHDVMNQGQFDMMYFTLSELHQAALKKCLRRYSLQWCVNYFWEKSDLGKQ